MPSFNHPKFFRFLLSLVTAFQIAFAPSLALGGGTANLNRLAPAAGHTGELDSFQRTLLQFAPANGSIRWEDLQMRELDSLRLSGQRVQVGVNVSQSAGDSRSQTTELDDIRVDVPQVVYSKLRVVYRPETLELVIEGVAGENSKGENGVVIARHIIPSMDVATMSYDQELISIVDSRGAYHVIDMGYVYSHAFKGPIPVFQNLWRPTAPLDFSSTQLSSTYLSLNQPIDLHERDIPASAVILRNEKGEAVLQAGDFMVTARRAGSQTSNLIGIFSRDATHNILARRSLIFALQVSLAFGDVGNSRALEKILAQLEALGAISEANLANNSLSPITRDLMSVLGKDQINTMLDRATAHQKAASRRYHLGTIAEYNSHYQDFTRRLADLEARAKNEQRLLTEAEQTWQSVFSSDSRLTAEPSSQPDRAQQTIGRPKSIVVRAWSGLTQRFGSKRFLGALFASGAAVGYVGLPYSIEAGDLTQFKTAMWLYNNAYPSIFADAEYRSTLLKSMVSLVAILPAIYGLSALAGGILTRLSAKLESDPSKLAGRVRDLARTWVPLSNWQRIYTAGMRLYAFTVYPYYKLLVKGALKQTAALSALENNQNPLRLVSPQSEIGRRANLQAPVRVGISNPFASPEDRAETFGNQTRVQGELVKQNREIGNFALLLATLVVAESENVDPATLTMVMSGDLNTNAVVSLQKVLSDPVKRKEWMLLTTELNRQQMVLASLHPNEYCPPKSCNLSEPLLAQYTEMAVDAVRRIRSHAGFRNELIRLRTESNRQANSLKTWIFTLGESDATFLRTAIVNDYVARQTKEATVIDHAMVVGIYSLVGARANPNDPKQLAADPNGPLWTSGPQLYEVNLNLALYLLKGGSQLALRVQKLAAREEQNYMPFEDATLTPNDRTQSFSSTLVDWVDDVANPVVADLGGQDLMRMYKSITTIQASITLAVVLRYGLTDQSLSQALAGWALFFLASVWYYGWVWIPVERGNQLQDERFAQQAEAAQSGRSNLAQGLRLGNTPQGASLRQLGREQLIDLYLRHNPRALNAAKEQKGTELSDEELLGLSMIQSPVYTSPHPLMTWSATWTGAVVSTVLSIPLSIMSFDPKALEASNLLRWLGISTVGYAAVYLAAGGKPWEYYLSKIEAARNTRFGSRILPAIIPGLPGNTPTLPNPRAQQSVETDTLAPAKDRSCGKIHE